MKTTCALLTVFVLMTGLADAQTVGASLQGTVSDKSGAVLPGAEVTVKNAGTGASSVIGTDERGRYLVPLLQPGDYEVQVSLSGFMFVFTRKVCVSS